VNLTILNGSTPYDKTEAIMGLASYATSLFISASVKNASVQLSKRSAITIRSSLVLYRSTNKCFCLSGDLRTIFLRPPENVYLLTIGVGCFRLSVMTLLFSMVIL
jgi:hypothetical protein